MDVRENLRKYASIDGEGQGGAPWIISGLGIVLAGLSLWYLIVFKALGITGELTTSALVMRILEVLLLGSFSVILVYAGYWLETTRFDKRKVWWAGLWTVMGLAGIVGIVAFVQSVQIQSGQPIQEPLLVQELLLAAGGGGLAGLLIGISTVQATWNKEQAARQRDTLEFMNELLRHNVLNGMQVMLAYTDLLREEVERDEALEYIETMETRGEDVVELIRNVRVLARSVSGDADLRETDLSTVVQDELARARASYGEATFDVDVPPEVTVRADDLVRAVVENVLANAVDHNDVTDPHVEVTVDRRDGDAVLAIADNGPGVAEENKDRYFEPGEQDEGSVGQGLGLYLVHTLVQRYDGEVWIEDNDGGGAVCKVRLPLA